VKLRDLYACLTVSIVKTVLSKDKLLLASLEQFYQRTSYGLQDMGNLILIQNYFGNHLEKFYLEGLQVAERIILKMYQREVV
jgi:hypothetical protein